jgi:hypothetical protein
VTIAAKALDQFLDRQIAVEKADARTGRHDPRDVGFGGFEHLVDEHPLRGLDDPGFLAVGHQRPQFVGLEDVLASDVLADDEGRDAVGDHAHDVAQGGDDEDPLGQEAGRQQRRELGREIDRDRLRRHFAEQQQQRHHHQDVDPAGIFLAEGGDQDHRHVGRGGDVDQLVAAEQRDDQSPWLVEHGVNALGMRIARIAQFLQVDPTERKERGFRPGKKGRHREQAALYQDAHHQFPVD